MAATHGVSATLPASIRIGKLADLDNIEKIFATNKVNLVNTETADNLKKDTSRTIHLLANVFAAGIAAYS
jgi:hypothetical protein